MSMIVKFAATSLALGAISFAGIAKAESYTFAQYSAITPGANIEWKNSGSNGASGKSGSIYTIATPGSSVAGSRAVAFSFLQPSISPYVNSVTANFTLFATATTTPAVVVGGFIVQQNIQGTFSFLSTTEITVGTNVFAIGSNLLSGSFSLASIGGQRSGAAGSFSASTTAASTVTYTSDFLSFIPTNDRDFGLALTSITSVLQATPTSSSTPTNALRTFKAVSSGSFSSDPAPEVTAVPEPAVWGLMILGFGMVGVQARRRARKTVYAV